jgi:hypothetical protein
MHFSQDQRRPELQEPVPTGLQMKKAILKTAKLLDAGRNGAGRQTAAELDERRRFLLGQADQIKRKYAN